MTPNANKNRNKPAINKIVKQAPKCKKCSKNITAIKFPGLNCCNCKTYYHAACINMKPETLTSLIDSGADWTCQSCKSRPGTSSRRSTIIPPSNSATPPRGSNISHANDSTASTEVSSVMRDVAQMKETVSSFEDSIKFFSTKFDEFKTQIGNLESTISRVMELENQTKSLSLTVEQLSARLNGLELETHKSDIVLCGVPEFEDDEYLTTDVVVDFVNKITPSSMAKKFIKSANRITQRQPSVSSNSSGRPRKIFVRFYSQDARDFVMHSVRNKKKTTKTIEMHGTEVNYYAADYLTPYFNQLLYSVKDFAHSNKFERVWVSNSNILLKRNSSEPPYTIKSYKDLDKITIKPRS